MSNTPSYQKGEILYIDLGEVGSPAIKGHEQGNSRPCVVITSLHRIGLLIIIPFTSRRPSKLKFYHVKVAKNIGGLTMDSYALCHQIRTIATDRVKRYIGKLPTNYLNRIRTVLWDLIS